MKDQPRQRIRIEGKTYTRTVRFIWNKPDGLAELAHGLVRIGGENRIVRLRTEGFYFNYDSPDYTPTWVAP